MSLLLLVNVDDRPLFGRIVPTIQEDLSLIREHDLYHFVAEPEEYGMLSAEPLFYIGYKVMLLS
jgi:hypothetical protein